MNVQQCVSSDGESVRVVIGRVFEYGFKLPLQFSFVHPCSTLSGHIPQLSLLCPFEFGCSEIGQDKGHTGPLGLSRIQDLAYFVQRRNIFPFSSPYTGLLASCRSQCLAWKYYLETDDGPAHRYLEASSSFLELGKIGRFGVEQTVSGV